MGKEEERLFDRRYLQFIKLSKKKKQTTRLKTKLNPDTLSINKTAKEDQPSVDNQILPQKKVKKIQKKSKTTIRPDKPIDTPDYVKDPPFFDIIIERRHAEQLSKSQLDPESRLLVIYSVLKEQLRRAKKDLLEMKGHKFA